MQYWLYFYLVLVPILIFSANPRTSCQWRMGRMSVAFTVGYGATLGVLYLFYHYQSTYSRLGVHWLLLGWFWTTMYMGWWEMIWRLYYRKQLISFHRGLGDDPVSNGVKTRSIIFTIIATAFFTCALLNI